jgi:hypothetical protein
MTGSSATELLADRSDHHLDPHIVVIQAHHIPS